MPQPDNAEVLVPGLAIRGAGLDHWSEIRHVHASAFRRLAGPAIDEQQCEAFVARIYEPDYTVTLQTHDLIVAWLDNRPIGTAGWVPFDQRGTIARIASVYVSPQFTRLGIGRRLVTAAEARARSAGFASFAARAFLPTTAFFEAIGYARSSQGVHEVGTEDGIPVVFMRKPGGDKSGGLG
jgi:GNAT superfamily N-acetyltransferase